MKNNKKFMVIGLAIVLAVAVVVGGGVFMQGKIALNKNINRAELTKMLAFVLADKLGDNLADYDCVPFSDVPANHWAAPYVCYLTEMGILKGYADNTFKPGANVLRNEAAKFFFEVFTAAGGDVGKQGPNPAYSDVANTNSWYYTYVQSISAAGIWDRAPWQGYKFRPSDSLTKGSAKVWTDKLENVLTSPF